MSKWNWDIRQAPSCSYLNDEQGEVILEVTPECLPSEATMLLISAAPDMLALLERFLLRPITISIEDLADAHRVVRKARGFL